jgi:hypothetical protein
MIGSSKLRRAAMTRSGAVAMLSLVVALTVRTGSNVGAGKQRSSRA